MQHIWLKVVYINKKNYVKQKQYKWAGLPSVRTLVCLVSWNINTGGPKMQSHSALRATASRSTRKYLLNKITLSWLLDKNLEEILNLMRKKCIFPLHDRRYNYRHSQYILIKVLFIFILILVFLRKIKDHIQNKHVCMGHRLPPDRQKYPKNWTWHIT